MSRQAPSCEWKGAGLVWPQRSYWLDAAVVPQAGRRRRGTGTKSAATSDVSAEVNDNVEKYKALPTFTPPGEAIDPSASTARACSSSRWSPTRSTRTSRTR